MRWGYIHITAGEHEGAGDNPLPPARWLPVNAKELAVGLFGAPAVRKFLVVIVGASYKNFKQREEMIHPFLS
jgi:hypothetical protein